VFEPKPLVIPTRERSETGGIRCPRPCPRRPWTTGSEGPRRIGKGTTSSRAATVATIQAASAAEGRTSYHLDRRVAKLKLESTGTEIDRLTPEQEEYLAGCSEGT
jgi:hypothetical protein